MRTETMVRRTLACLGEGRRCIMRGNEAQGVTVPAVDASKLGVADANCVLQHGCKHWLKIAGELEITWSTSDVAVCCSSASRSSRPSRATSVSSPVGDELEPATAFGALRRFGFGVFRRRPLIGPPPVLERLFIACP